MLTALLVRSLGCPALMGQNGSTEKNADSQRKHIEYLRGEASQHHLAACRCARCVQEQSAESDRVARLSTGQAGICMFADSDHRLCCARCEEVVDKDCPIFSPAVDRGEGSLYAPDREQWGSKHNRQWPCCIVCMPPAEKVLAIRSYWIRQGMRGVLWVGGSKQVTLVYQDIGGASLPMQKYTAAGIRARAKLIDYLQDYTDKFGESLAVRVGVSPAVYNTTWVMDRTVQPVPEGFAIVIWVAPILSVHVHPERNVCAPSTVSNEMKRKRCEEQVKLRQKLAVACMTQTGSCVQLLAIMSSEWIDELVSLLMDLSESEHLTDVIELSFQSWSHAYTHDSRLPKMRHALIHDYDM